MSVGKGFQMGCGALLAVGVVKVIGAILTLGALFWFLAQGDGDQAASSMGSDQPAAAASATHCGVMNGGSTDSAGNVRDQSWRSYVCESRGQASDRWNDCLRRSDYTVESGSGCPGAQRCCPPVDLADE